MKKLLRMMLRIDCRKLFLVGAIITITGFVLQTFSLPCPLTIRIVSSPVTSLSYKSLNVDNIAEIGRVSSIDVSLNYSTDFHQSVPVAEDRKIVSTRKNVKLKVSVTHLPSNSPTTHRKTLTHLRKMRSWTTDEALVYAKKEIENASAITSDPDLHAPLFRNISVFKRSYELMEQILKVYIYQDGKRPIFHQPYLKGIYSSEGWFMKLMEENRQFVTKEPQKAHLFYLPYSARQLETALYVPNSHNMKPLSIFLRNYVNMLAAKYPFWNRTHGSDHFLVACHDWSMTN